VCAMKGSRFLQARPPNNQTPYFRVTFEAFRCLFHYSCYLLHGEADNFFILVFFSLSLSKLEKCIVFAKIKKKKSGHLLILLHLILVLLIISNLIYLFFNFITWHLIFFFKFSPLFFWLFFFSYTLLGWFVISILSIVNLFYFILFFILILIIILFNSILVFQSSFFSIPFVLFLYFSWLIFFFNFNPQHLILFSLWINFGTCSFQFCFCPGQFFFEMFCFDFIYYLVVDMVF
jgi:hypothetical protein